MCSSVREKIKCNKKMKRDRLSDEDQFAVVWGERQDELVAQIKLLIEQLNKQEESEFKQKWEKTSAKSKKTYVHFCSDWMMPKNAEMRFRLYPNGLWVYSNPVMFQEFNQIATKFVQDAIKSAKKEATFDRDWVCAGEIDTLHHSLSNISASVCLTTKEKFPTK
jgi:hypothetical protein